MSSNSPEVKPKRKAISLDTKIKVLNLLALGKRATAVGRHFGISEATVRTIKKKESAIRRSVRFGTEESVKTTLHTRNSAKEKMEKILVMCIEKMVQQGKPVKSGIIKKTAIDIYNRLNEAEADNPTHSKNCVFAASNGWLKRFRERHNIKLRPGDKSDDEDGDENPLLNTNNGLEVLHSDFLNHGLELARQLGEHFQQCDPDKERAANFRRQLELLMAPYKDMYRNISLNQTEYSEFSSINDFDPVSVKEEANDYKEEEEERELIEIQEIKLEPTK
ncbi:tigger transposable element-derived protein 1 [Musca domestica]|uniref:Tigger transposable element-derived protein 1 n=1 Tax=Musca domestica TaxID=7370 RepID=A0A1I8NJ24_MUSDO|nr:tigger transposable element-derived protein 1 [Musca domestica]XP_058978387.1 tigger transposable element-derived protein 1 [Musca domestica]